jgi:hypothetical protein
MDNTQNDDFSSTKEQWVHFLKFKLDNTKTPKSFKKSVPG